MNDGSTLVIIILGALFYAPVYVPFLVSFFLRSRVIRWCLRVSSLAAVLFVLVRPPGLKRDTTGQDIAGSFDAASHNIPIYIGWIWGGSLLLHAVGIGIGSMLQKLRKERQ